jgi:TRAP-type C4-dicarboxylate transport system substrate-binding protein
MSLMRTLLAGAALAAMAVPAAAQRWLTLGMQDNEVSNLCAGARACAAKMAELSGGAITVPIFPASQPGDFRAMVAQVQAGASDMVSIGHPDMIHVIPELTLIGAPHGAREKAQAHAAIANPFVASIALRIPNDLRTSPPRPSPRAG